MTNYYFLIAAFPPLTLGVKPEISFQQLKEMLQLNLTAQDMRAVTRLLRPIDLYNIRALWMGLPLDERGNFNAQDLEEELLVREALPESLIEYLERYETTEERLRYFSSLFVSLYRDKQTKLKGFLRKIYQFERELRLVLTALRAKEVGRDLVRELQFEDLTDSLVASILAQKDAPEYMPPQEYEDLKTLFVDNRFDPARLHEAILEYRLRKIEEMEEPQDFGIDRVLAYVSRFLLVESLSELSREKGKEQLSEYG